MVTPPKKISMDNVPVELLFSMMLSSINTALIFLVSASGVITLVVYKKKKKRFDQDMNELIVENKEELTEEEINRILSFDPYEDN